MWNWIRTFFSTSKPIIFTGALPDERLPDEKADDISFSEIVAKTATITWNPLDISKLPSWPVMDQDGSSACVAFTKALMSSILYYIRTGNFLQMSPKWIYSFRANKPAPGMVGYDAFDVEANVGLIPEDMEPSQGISEAKMNAFTALPWEVEVGKALRMSDQRIIAPTRDLATLASIQQVTGKPIMVWYQWYYDEWTRAVPTVLYLNPPYIHSVCFVPPRTPDQNSIGTYNNQKAIVIQDSWGLDPAEGTIDGKRIITEAFHKTRNIFAAYSMRFKFDEAQGQLPEFDGTIISLQKCLRYEGCFPLNVAFIESLGPITRKSLAQFQQKHSLVVTSAIDAPTTTLLKALYP